MMFVISKIPQMALRRQTTTTLPLTALSTLGCRPLSTAPSSPPDTPSKNLVTHEEGVHQTMKLSKTWRNKPLFRRQGDVRFKTGSEAASLLVREAKRRDPHEEFYIDSVSSVMTCLSPIFDRNPRYAFVAKQLMEPERSLQFRVAWIDDTGVIRLNRGYRLQFNSALGPYEGDLHFGSHVNSGVIKALGFGAVFSHALTGFDIGAAIGGSDFNPLDKSEAEIQRFCQAYMTELSKYVGPDVDHPTMGMGVGSKEMGYLYGQYKRINGRIRSGGVPFLDNGDPMFPEAPGYGVAHFASTVLEDKNDTLEGKRCLILGSGKLARSLADKLLSYGAIPLSFSDRSGFVYEPNGFDPSKLRHIHTIKADRSAQVGRYIISSTTAKFNEPADIFDIPCDLCFPCGAIRSLGKDAVNKLADNGCRGVFEGGDLAVTLDARKCLKKRGLIYGPYSLTVAGARIVNGLSASKGRDITENNDDLLKAEVEKMYFAAKSTAQEFNARGDLFAGANIAGFLRVANVMLSHGAV